MRICIIGNPNSIHIHRWINYFMSQGDEIHLIGTKYLISALPKVTDFYDLTRYTNTPKLRYAIWSLVARKLIKRINPDILHAHQVTKAGWIGAASGYRPFMVTGWGSDLLIGPQKSPIQRQLAKWVLNRADTIVCVSNGLAHAATELGVCPDKLIISPWGVDTSVYFPVDLEQKRSLRAIYDLEPDIPVVLSIRTLQSNYNPLTLAEAIPKILSKISPVYFIIRTYNGDQNLIRKFQQIIESHNVSDYVRYVGNLPDEKSIVDLYQLTDIAVSIPSSDGTPSSVFEAMVCGAVPVLSDLPSLHEWVMPEKEGIYVPVGNSDKLAHAIITLLQNDTLRESVYKNAIELVYTQMNRQTLMKYNSGIYRNQLEIQ